MNCPFRKYPQSLRNISILLSNPRLPLGIVFDPTDARLTVIRKQSQQHSKMRKSYIVKYVQKMAAPGVIEESYCYSGRGECYLYLFPFLALKSSIISKKKN